jgi:hypothetical protein
MLYQLQKCYSVFDDKITLLELISFFEIDSAVLQYLLHVFVHDIMNFQVGDVCLRISTVSIMSAQINVFSYVETKILPCLLAKCDQNFNKQLLL